jgi:hypothetical protein
MIGQSISTKENQSQERIQLPLKSSAGVYVAKKLNGTLSKKS